ncbi:MAG: glycosyltransferase family 9 protein [Candidatus Eutrophobiaceae bacterium]
MIPIPPRILIIKQGALGDILIALPIIRKIVEHHSGKDLSLLTAPEYRNAFFGFPKLRVLCAPRKGGLAMLKIIRSLRRTRYDRIYDLQSSERSSMLCALSGSREIVGNHPRFPYSIHPPNACCEQQHIFQRLNETLAAANIPTAAERAWFPVAPEHCARIDAWLRDRGLRKGAFAICHAGSSSRHMHKRWNGFAELALRLKDRGLATIWVGSKEDCVLNAKLSEQTGIDSSCLFSLPELVALGACACFAVTTDSAPMHILASSGIPVFALFGKTHWKHSHALGQEKYVIPASDYGSSEINGIAAQTVLERIDSFRLISFEEFPA